MSVLIFFSQWESADPSATVRLITMVPQRVSKGRSQAKPPLATLLIAGLPLILSPHAIRDVFCQ